MSGFYPEEIIEEIRVNNDIVEVVSEYVKLDKKGKDYFGLCPFHKEKTPSFSVVPSKQIFYCFGCGKGGNVFQFVMNIENLDYAETIKHLADRARIQLPEGDSREDMEKARLKQKLLQINTEAARYFHSQLKAPQHRNAAEYLSKRGISENTIRKFGIGYCPEEWDSLFRHFQEKGYARDELLHSGLVLPSKNGGCYDRFRHRVMFPIFDIRGNVIGFGGRVMDGSHPKYMNSPETLVYNKGRHLFAMNFAKNAGDKKLVVVEGYMDAISLHQYGIQNAVASLGTALTEGQGRMLKKYAEEIIISYDADTAGQAATMRGLDLLNELGCSVKVLQVPDGKDPDEFIRKHGPDEFRRLIDNSISLVEYKIKVLKNQIDTSNTDGKINFLNRSTAVLAKIDNRVEREMHVKKLAKDYEISEESIYSEVVRKMKPKTSFRSPSAKLDEINQKIGKKTVENVDNKVMYLERILLAFLCSDNTIFRKLGDRINLDMFTGENNRQAADIAFKRLESRNGIVPAELMSLFTGVEAGEFAQILQNECNCDDNLKAASDIIRKLELHKMEERQRQILAVLKDENSLPEGDVEKLRQELKNIVMRKTVMG